MPVKVYQALVNNIERGMIAPVYLFYGSESYLREKSVAALKKHLASGDMGQFNLSIIDAAQARTEEIIDAANTVSFFAERRLVIVENPTYFKSMGKKTEGEDEEEQGDGDINLLNYLQEPNPGTCLVFVTGDSVNSRTKAFKAVSKTGQALEFKHIKRRELEDWAKDRFRRLGKKIDAQALQYLVALNPEDMGILCGEIEKLSLLDLRQERVSIEQVKLAASASAEASIFDLVDFIGEKRSTLALEKLREIMGQGELPLRMLAMISRQLRLILVVKSLTEEGYSQEDLVRALGMHPYPAGKIIGQARNFSVEQLEQALEICLEIDLALKTSKGSPALLLELAVVCIGRGLSLNLSA